MSDARLTPNLKRCPKGKEIFQSELKSPREKQIVYFQVSHVRMSKEQLYSKCAFALYIILYPDFPLFSCSWEIFDLLEICPVLGQQKYPCPEEPFPPEF